MLDIAHKAGLSRATVSLAMQGSSLLREETRKQVIDAAQALGYVYNRGAANLRKARSDIIGMVINDLTNPFFAELAVGCERALQKEGLVVFMANTSEDLEQQSVVVRRMREQGVAGLIICPAHGTPSNCFDELHAAGIPVVQAMRHVGDGRASIVVPDNAAGAAEAVAHLLAMGHRRVAFAGGYADTSVLEDRIRGYHLGLASGLLAHDPALVALGAPSRAFGASIVADFLAMPDPPTAILCFNDTVALGFCLGLRRVGREPGRDFAVIGFDDVEEAALATPALTTVAVDAQELGETAARILLAQFASQEPAPTQHIGPARLTIRDSSGERIRISGSP